MSNPLVSIVVPIYRVERYLRQCVDSILVQTLKRIEIILVDDGSPDNCPAIADEYAAQDSRVVVVHQANGGYGKAVNNGISVARAPYIGIIESDDWIEPTMFEKLYNRAVETGADLVKCLFWEYNSQEVEEKQNVLIFRSVADFRQAPDGVFIAREWENIFMFPASLWSCLYKADFIRKVPLIETAGAAYQDTPFVMETMALAKSISIVKEPLVHYRREPGQGSSSEGGSSRSLQVLDMSLAVQNVMSRYSLFEYCPEACYYQIFSTNMWGLDITGEAWKEEYFNRFRLMWKAKMKDCRAFSWKYFNNFEKKRAELIVESSSYDLYVAEMNAYLQKKLEEAKMKYPKLLHRYRKLQMLCIFAVGKMRKRLKVEKQQLKKEIRKCRDVFQLIH